jgi:hypothetical protein
MKKKPGSSKYTWPPNNTRVYIIRHRHGWHDGNLAGILIRPGLVRGDDGFDYVINHARDIRIAM